MISEFGFGISDVGGMSDFGFGMSDLGEKAPTRSRSGRVKAGGVEAEGGSGWFSGVGGAMLASVTPRSRVGFLLGGVMTGAVRVRGVKLAMR